MTASAHAPSISVVIPTRNRPGLLLERALPSALGQTYTNIEIIVVIDGPDPLTERALATVHDSRLRVLALPENVGGSDARNAGVRASRGEWIAFLDDDDEWLPEKLEWQLRAARASHYPWPIVASGWLTRTPQGDFHSPSRIPDAGEPIGDYLLARKSLRYRECSLMSTIIFTKKALLLRVPFQSGLVKHQDTDWLLRVAQCVGVGIEVPSRVMAISYYEDDRAQTSQSLRWRWSLEWIKAHRKANTVSDRAYVGFIISSISHVASKANATEAFWPLLKALLRHKPRPFELARFAIIWSFPENLRARFRGSPRMVYAKKSSVSG